MTWKPAKVGCHWFAERQTRFGLQSFAISTRVTVRDGKIVLTYPDSGYALYCNCDERGLFKTLDAAQRAADKTPRRLTEATR